MSNTKTKNEITQRLGIEEALAYHLRYNHYPPVDVRYLETAKRAIELAKDGEWTATVLELDSETAFTVEDIIENLHLESFIHGEEEIK